MTAAIAAEGLRKSFGDIQAVRGVSLDIEEGTIFGLVGPDGAGKTTMMRMLCAILAPDSGRARVGGHDTLAEAESIKEQIGYMPQRFSLYGDLTVTENLEFYADVYQVPAAVRPARMAELLEFSQLKGHTYKLADQLSGGMKQKLALACNLIHEPRFLLLDEPTTGVDPVARREFWKILFRLRQQGTTLLVSTPYMDEAERCDRVGFMYQGEIIAADTPRGMRRYFTAHLLELECDQPHVARNRLREWSGVRNASLHGTLVHLVVDDPGRVTAEVPGVLREAGISLTRLEPVEPSLEDVFVFLTSTRQGS